MPCNISIFLRRELKDDAILHVEDAKDDDTRARAWDTKVGDTLMSRDTALWFVLEYLFPAKVGLNTPDQTERFTSSHIDYTVTPAIMAIVVMRFNIYFIK